MYYDKHMRQHAVEKKQTGFWKKLAKKIDYWKKKE